MRSLFFLFALFVSLHSLCQVSEVNGKALYFKLGINRTNVSNWDDGKPTYALIRPFGGLGVYLRLGKPERVTTAMAIEVNFSGQGFSMKNNTETVKARLTYMNLSILPKQYFGHFFIAAGPEAGVLLSAHEVVDDRRELVPAGIYSKTVFNGIAGIGLNFGNKNSRQIDFGMEITYKKGFSKVRTDFTEARHSVFSFSMFIPVSLFADIRQR